MMVVHVGAFTSRMTLFVRECDGLTILQQVGRNLESSVKYVPQLDRNTGFLYYTQGELKQRGRFVGRVRWCVSRRSRLIVFLLSSSKQELSFLARKIARVGTSVVAFGDYPRRRCMLRGVREQESSRNGFKRSRLESIDLFHFS